MASKALKKKAWSLFSLYIKLRDANSEGICGCCTCGSHLPFDSKDCHAGHFVAGRTNDVLFDEKIVNSQCACCNIWHSGNQGKYVLFMKKKYGHTDDDIEQLLTKKHGATKVSDVQMTEMMFNFYSAIQSMLMKKFKDDKDIQKRALDKIKAYGLMKFLDVKNTWGL